MSSKMEGGVELVGTSSGLVGTLEEGIQQTFFQPAQDFQCLTWTLPPRVTSDPLIGESVKPDPPPQLVCAAAGAAAAPLYRTVDPRGLSGPKVFVAGLDRKLLGKAVKLPKKMAVFEGGLFFTSKFG